MIEVEKKFRLTDEEEKRLTDGAEFLGVKTFTDVYCDTPDYALMKSDRWLRARDGKWELKVSLKGHRDGTRMGDQYEEIEDEARIRAVLGFPVVGDFQATLASFGWEPFCRLTTTRRKYKKDGFTIDLDDADYGDFRYRIGEIELMVGDQSEMDAAMDRIFAFAREHGIIPSKVHGKILAYLKARRPAAYADIRAAWGMKDF